MQNLLSAWRWRRSLPDGATGLAGIQRVRHDFGEYGLFDGTGIGVSEVPEANVGPEEKADKPGMAEVAAKSSGNVTVADISGNPAHYTGKIVTVVAEVEEVLGPRTFKLDEDNALAGGIDKDMLVLSPKASTLADIEDQWLNTGGWWLISSGRLVGIWTQRSNWNSKKSPPCWSLLQSKGFS